MGENTVYWFSKIKNIEETAKERGYTVEESAPVITIELSEVFASTKIKNMMTMEIPEVECLIFGELWQYQIGDILDMIRSKGINKDVSWFEEFDGELSQAVYDEEDNLLAVLMCTAGEEGIFAHLLLSFSGDTRAVMSALQGFLNAAWDWEEGKDAITMVVVNDGIRELMDQMLHKKTHKKVIGKVHCIEDVSEEDEEFLSMLEEAEEISVIQNNISWKMEMLKNSDSE